MMQSVDDEDVHEHVGFELALSNFSGPFDVLLSLIARRRMDVTEIALAEVTDEFIAYVSTLDTTAEVLENSTSFMVVAATLLELKTSRLLPRDATDTTDEMALLEERDLLFARLLQYKAFKEVASMIELRLHEQLTQYARPGGQGAQNVTIQPELALDVSVEQLAALAADIFENARDQLVEVGTQHLHAPIVSLSEQIELMTQRIQQEERVSFSALIVDASRIVIVVRFLGLLAMYRDQLIVWEQDHPLGEITLYWGEV